MINTHLPVCIFTVNCAKAAKQALADNQCLKNQKEMVREATFESEWSEDCMGERTRTYKEPYKDTSVTQ